MLYTDQFLPSNIIQPLLAGYSSPFDLKRHHYSNEIRKFHLTNRIGHSVVHALLVQKTDVQLKIILKAPTIAHRFYIRVVFDSVGQ